MNMKNIIQRVGILAVLCLAPLAYADTLVFQGVQFGQAYGGYNVGEYNFTVNGGPVVAGICDNYGNTLVSPQIAAAHTTSTLATLDGARFANPANATNQAQYNQVLYLADLLLALPDNAALLTRTNLQYAIWGTFSNDAQNVAVGAGQGGAVAALQLEAANAVAGGWTGGGWTIYTPDPNFNQSGNLVGQEILSKTPDGGATLMLLGCALFGIETLRRKMRA
ncbi:MAG: hypothetical protein IPP47_34125 [Bryobacterales bacterium]|nr:hypothetical protein [Bryobacterales bacterium]